MTVDKPVSHRWATLVLMGFGVALVVVDITVINVIMPTIISSLDLQATSAEWINTIYPLVFAALLIPLGRLGDRWGSKRLFLSGLVVFGIASYLSGGASTAAGLVGFRAFQGVGAAMILPATLATVHSTFTGKDRAIAFGVWGSLIAGMAAVGPLLGGWLATEHSWRWAFFINVPLVVITVLAAFKWVEDRRVDSQERGFDFPGFATSVVGTFALVFALIEGPRHGWISQTDELWLGAWRWPDTYISVVPLAAALGVGLLMWFVKIERRRVDDSQVVLFDFGLFELDTFRRGNLLAAIVGMGEFGLVFVLPLFARIVLGATAFETGRLFLAMAAGGFIGGPLAAEISRRRDPRTAVMLGMAMEAVAVLWIVGLLAGQPQLGQIAVPLFLYGVGVGIASAQLASVVMSEVPEKSSGQASGMQSTARQVGAALGIAVLGSVFISSLGVLTRSELLKITALDEQTRNLFSERVADSAGWYVEALRLWNPNLQPVVEGIERAIGGAAQRAALVAFVFFVLGIFQASRLPSGPLRRNEPDPANQNTADEVQIGHES